MRTHHVTCDRCGDTKKTADAETLPSDWKEISINAIVMKGGVFAWSDYDRRVQLCVECQKTVQGIFRAMFDLPKAKEDTDG